MSRLTERVMYKVNQWMAMPARVFHKGVYSRERLLPDYEPFVKWRKAHFERYHFAARHLRPDDTVLDLACGVGYGAEILGRSCRTVTGVDLSPETVRYAQRRYGTDTVVFVAGDFFGHPALAGVDVAVSFETIEHIRAPLEKTLRSLVARANRLVIGSIPHAEAAGNPYHVHFGLLDHDLDVLQEFGRVSLYGQEPEPGYRILPRSEVPAPQNLVFVLEKEAAERRNQP